MFLKPVYCAGLCLCLILPAWADDRAMSLTIVTDIEQNADPALQSFMQQVWSENPAVQGAQAALDAAKARAESAVMPLHNPVLELDTEQTGTSTTSLGLSQTIDLSNKREAQIQVAARQVQVAEAALKVVRQRISAEALSALVRYYAAREQQVLASRAARLMKRFADAVQQRQRAGDVAALDVTLAQVAYSEALMEQAASDSKRVEAESALQAVSGISVTHWPRLPEKLAPPPDDADPALLDSLPELEMLRSRMAAARARIDLARKQGKIDPTFGIRAGQEESDRLVGLSIGFPLFVRNNYQAEIRAASHDAAAETLAYHDARQRASARLHAALGRFGNTARAWRTWRTTGQRALGKQMELLEQMWQAGELTATDFLIQAKQNIDTQATATKLMSEVWLSAIDWLAASGQIKPWLGVAGQDIKMNSGE